VRLLEDNQFQRDRLYIVGVCCPGMKDPLKAIKRNSGLLHGIDAADDADKCNNCVYPNPVIYDELLGDEQEPHIRGERFARLKKLKT
jgi:formate dehydrogenase subunit beta